MISNMFSSFPDSKNEYEYWQVIFTPLMEKQVCTSYELGYSINVIKGEFEGDKIGEWRSFNKTITLEDSSTDTIAHEAYHATQTILDKYDLYSDEEYGAYIQGSLTNCIDHIVKEKFYE